MAGLRIITQPTAEQITLAEARLHLRIDDDADSPAAHPDDPWLTGIGIPAAREYCEGWLGSALASVTLELALDNFYAPVECRWGRNWCWRMSSESSPCQPAGFPLPMAPLQSVDSVRYYDGDGTLQTLHENAYYVDTYGSRIVLVDGTSWPTTQTRPNAVLVRYQAGYSLVGDSPDPYPLPYAIRAAMRLVLGDLYENRENSAEKKLEDIPIAAKNLMQPYRLRLGMA